MAADGRTPDNAAGWDRLADAYQREVGWPQDELSWGLRCPPEADLRLVSDVVEDATTLVIGCGGGQDLVALSQLGAGRLLGVDPSAQQLRHARERLAQEGIPAQLLVGHAAGLDGVEDASVDLVVSVQAFNYVGDVSRAVAELVRVLRPGGHVAISVLHPADISTDDAPPYGWHTSWFQVERDWVWDGLAEEPISFRSWFRSASAWFTAFTEGGLLVERLVEPPPVDDPRWVQRGWLDADTHAKLDMVPSTVALRARRPD